MVDEPPQEPQILVDTMPTVTPVTTDSMTPPTPPVVPSSSTPIPVITNFQHPWFHPNHAATPVPQQMSSPMEHPNTFVSPRSAFDSNGNTDVDVYLHLLFKHPYDQKGFLKQYQVPKQGNLPIPLSWYIRSTIRFIGKTEHYGTMVPIFAARVQD
jgi:hypothetical protein